MAARVTRHEVKRPGVDRGGQAEFLSSAVYITQILWRDDIGARATSLRRFRLLGVARL